MSLTPLNTSDLPWLAEQYILGDLDAMQRDAFEARLATDQSAREAVASAVALLAAVHTAQSSPLVESKQVASTFWSSKIAWFSGAAAALAIAAFLGWQFNGFRAASDSKLATAWSETRETMDDLIEERELLVAETQSALSVEESDLPDWLMTAVSLQEEDSPGPQPPSIGADTGEGA